MRHFKHFKIDELAIMRDALAILSPDTADCMTTRDDLMDAIEAELRLRPYFTLCEKIGGKWCQQFGDYDRETVRAERQEMRDGGIMAKNLTILTTPADAPSIDAAIAALNKGA